jgi:hypothetical protein
MRRGTRTRIVGLLSGAVLLLGAGSAFAAPSGTLAPADHGRRGGSGDHGDHDRRHHLVVIGKIVDTDDHTFTLATRFHHKVKVHWDRDTKFRGGDKKDLDKGEIVGVVGEHDWGKIHAKVIFFPHRDHDWGHH